MIDRNIEILAPAGSFECMKAAFCAGADAVYAGGDLFGARASAVNFSKDEVLDAIDYAHLRGKKFYLTVNTLLKEEELNTQLFRYLLPFYEQGLDAVIVQDMGVLRFVNSCFSGLAIHASTQLNTTGVSFAKELKRLGVQRIVTARELSLSEIKEIKEETGLEIESFVHGALCYSYSGQCLLSSMIGGRSGNRGRCAQPCRLPYTFLSEEGLQQPANEKYLLSPKDLCTLHMIPQLIEAGVDSFKIEGRMKKPEYVALVTAMYRKYTDFYLNGGAKNFAIDEEDIFRLQDIYNRGNFTNGYYTQSNHRCMMSLQRPNHCGVDVATIQSVKKDTITLKLTKDLYPGDVLEFSLRSGKPDYTVGIGQNAGEELTIKNKFQNKKVITRESLTSMTVSRIRNNQLIQDITEKYMNNELKVPVKSKLYVRRNNVLMLELEAQGVSMTVFGAEVEEAVKQSVTEAQVREKFEQTGESEFVFDKLTIHVDDNCFVPMKKIKELRRYALDEIRSEILYRYRTGIFYDTEILKNSISKDSYRNQPILTVCVSTREQFDVAVSEEIARIYLETSLFSYEELYDLLDIAYNAKKEVYAALPYICRNSFKQEFLWQRDFYEDERLSGFVFRNLESFFFLKDRYDGNLKKHFIFEHPIYCYNSVAHYYLSSLGAEQIGFSRELTYDELKELHFADGVLDIYGAVPVMITANCIKKTLNHCDGQNTTAHIQREQLGEKYPFHTVCRHCYNVIYDTLPVCLFEEWEDINRLHPAAVKLNFTTESSAECKQVFEHLRKKKSIKESTKGHFRRGVL